MTPYPNHAPALPGTGEAIPLLRPRGELRGAVAVLTAEAAVLLVRGSAAALLLSPALLAGFLLAG